MGQVHIPFSESLGCKLMKKCDEFKNRSLLFQINRKSVKKKFGIRHASKQTSFSYPIFCRFLKNMHKKSEKDQIS
jgi:hypothetical protein